VASINSLFENYYNLLALALVVLVPIWFGKFITQAIALILARRRERHD
jgi:hypothetical protein